MSQQPPQSVQAPTGAGDRLHLEEWLNALTHGVGAVVALAAGAVLITLASIYGDRWAVIGASVYSASLLLLYLASTLYHAVAHVPTKAKLKIFDHCMIYVLIAGTYTPFTLTSLRGPWGWTLFGLIWGLAIAGIVFKLYFTGRFKWLSTGIYIAMGWLVVIAIDPVMRALPQSAFAWLLAGGIAYTAGTVFYMSRRLPYAHAIWHGFVIVGSVCHFAAVLIQVLAPVPLAGS
ncbi:MAG: hemolysin III family protein [Xanthomonadales bacterium]|nr:hemolysin III family protein [Xanthomonadales bacterium]MCP5473337.1 hemolysin III family protein [Rhodanobacteraceae bacterium]